MQTAVGPFTRKSAEGRGRGKSQGRLQMRASAEHKLLEQSPPEGKGGEDGGELSPQLQLPGAATSVTGNQSFWRHYLMAS